MERFDVVVIGAGPGGYVAAIRCAQLGLRTACVDDWRDEDGKPALGGACLNVGCIPSKALLDSSHTYHQLHHGLSAHGITVKGVQLDVAAMQARKTKVVRTLTGGVETLFLKHKITWLQGRGRLLEKNQVEIEDHGGVKIAVEAKHIVIATGSTPAPLAEAPFDGDHIVDSSGALAFEEVPKRLAVIGGGVIALELGSVWQRLGAEVTILNRGNTLLGRVEEELAKEAHRHLTAQGMDIRLGAKVAKVNVNKKQVTVHYRDAQGAQSLRADRVLVATGRQPTTRGLNAEAAGLALDKHGFIVVDEFCRTNLPGVYAIGDVVRGPMLAHKASEEGVAVAERIAGQASQVNYKTIPAVIYTWPEIAWVGKTSEQLRAGNTDFRAGMFPFAGNGRAHAMGDAVGLVKILSDSKTDRILGAHIIGPYASELIGEIVSVMEFGGAAEDIARTIHAHPTLSEAIHEAALAVGGRALHR
jgi:dihydrolipoamide dehydrogenase